MHRPILTRNFTAGSAVAARRIAQPGTEAGEVVQADGAGAAALGVADEVGAEEGGRADVHLAGIADVEAGGAFAAGAWLASDADGRAVAAAPPAPAVRSAVVDGADADADIAVEGVLAGDRLAAVVELAADGRNLVDRLAGGKASVAADGAIRTKDSTAGKKLLALWTRGGAVQAVGRAFAASAGKGDVVPMLIAPAAL